MLIFSRIVNGYNLLLILLKQKARKLLGGKIITVIGDSHCLLFQNEIFSIKYIGPATAYNLGKKKSTNQSRKKITSILKNLRPYSDVLFVFGEIDCRIHIYKIHKLQKISYSKAVYSTVDSYRNFIIEMKKKYPTINFIVCGIFPQGEQGNFYGLEFYANRKERMDISRIFNTKLELACKQSKIKYISVFEKLINSKGERIKKFVHDEIHFNKDIVPFILWELKKINVLN